jgi:hypothetical protein
MFGALATVCELDAKLHRSKLAAFGKRLLAADYTPEQVLSAYGPSSWWSHQDWRGKQGQTPTLEQVEATIAQAVKPLTTAPHSPRLTAMPDGSFIGPVMGPHARGL